MTNDKGREKADLESPDIWDIDHPSHGKPVRHPRAVVSVPFQPDEFEAVGAAAEKSGERLSVFIRNAAVGKARSVGTIIAMAVTHGNLVSIQFEETPGPLESSWSRGEAAQMPELATSYA